MSYPNCFYNEYEYSCLLIIYGGQRCVTKWVLDVRNYRISNVGHEQVREANQSMRL